MYFVRYNWRKQGNALLIKVNWIVLEYITNDRFFWTFETVSKFEVFELISFDFRSFFRYSALFVDAMKVKIALYWLFQWCRQSFHSSFQLSSHIRLKSMHWFAYWNDINRMPISLFIFERKNERNNGFFWKHLLLLIIFRWIWSWSP